MPKFILILCVVFSLGLIGCNGDKDTNAKANILMIGHSDSETNPIHISLLNFAKAVENRSSGTVQVKIFPAERLGSNAEMFKMVEKGSLDGMMLPAGQQAIVCPKFKTLCLPFLFSTYVHVYKVLDGPIGQELVEGLKDHNMIQLAYWENGLRQITTNKHLIKVPADLKGLKIRIPQDEITAEIFKTFGAEPSPYPFSQLYLALQQGLYDGQENPVANIYANKLHQVQKYLTILNYQYQPKTMIFGLENWNSLPANVQDIIAKAAKEFADEHRKAITSSEAKMLVDLDSYGIEIDYPDTEPFYKAAQPVYQHFYQTNTWAQDLVTRIKSLR